MVSDTENIGLLGRRRLVTTNTGRIEFNERRKLEISESQNLQVLGRRKRVKPESVSINYHEKRQYRSYEAEISDVYHLHQTNEIPITPLDQQQHTKRADTSTSSTNNISEASNSRAESLFPRNVAAFQYWFIFTDILAIALGQTCALGLTVFTNHALFGRSVPWVSNANGIDHLSQQLIITVCLIFWFENEGHYRNRIPFWMEVKKVMNVIFFVIMIDVFLQFSFKHDFSRLWLMSGWVITGITILIGRFNVRSILEKAGLWHIRVLLVGNGEIAKRALSTINNVKSIGYDLATQIPDLPEGLHEKKISWHDLCARHQADYVILAMDASEAAATDEMIDLLMHEGVAFSVFSPLENFPAAHLTVHHFLCRRDFLMVCDNKLDQVLPRLLKRCFDLMGSSLALILLSPLFLVIAFIVRNDGGPIFFKHQRLGLNGHSFDCLKFRSMIFNADQVLQKHLAENAEARSEWERDHKLKNDPRITAFGAFLRSSSIDELPQLINVLWGQMSLVGPRPIVVDEIRRYNKDIHYYNRVRPGITGLWQVSGRNDISYAERVKMDAWYVCNWSPWLDIKIILKTFPVLLNRKGAY